MAAPVLIEGQSGPIEITGTVTTSPPVGGATEAQQIIGNAELAAISAKDFATQTTLASLNAKVTAVNTGAVVVSSGTITGITNPVAVTGTFWQVTQPVSGTFWQTTQPVSGTFWQATQPVSAADLPLPLGAATSALQTQPGVDIGDVTVNNAAGGAAVNIQDGGNTITIDGAVTAAVTGTVTANVQATPTAIAPSYTEAELSSLSQTLKGFLRVLSGAVVNDGPSVLIDGEQSPLSVTNDGRLRVASVEARTSVLFFNPSEEKMWESLEADYTFTGSPWSTW